ncbi:hypothetical protein [Extensimonas sp. H3M7-6]|uniref:hypothetical protein n=1 Tax=Extensimonas soli TaxID=3031322 RepID=UPI0023DC492A|nr:hypothetical protein [Extensimonas sp. H3M7-6]MDF1483024.1 hypothetical protein [Extensimonas sp. H3M7-6]
MSLLAALDHLLNFLAPAAGVALLLVAGTQVFMRKRPSKLSWGVQAAILFIVGAAVLVAGIVLLGRDGKMLTYGALVLACASSQWLLLR